MIPKSISRALPRIAFLMLTGLACLLLSDLAPESLGSIGAPMLFGLGLCLTGLATGDIALRILQPKVDAQAAAERAMDGNIGAGLVYLGRCVLAAIVLMLVVTASRADAPPRPALDLLPILKAEQIRLWPTLPLPSTLGAQVEQETCPSPSSRMCWSPRAQLHTSREQGIGLGQLTRAFRTDGSTRFDTLTELRTAYPRELASLSWQTPFDPRLQLRALVLKDLQDYKLIESTDSDMARLAMTFAAYNGGMGGLNADRRACAGTRGCNPGVWFGHVERTSLKARASVPGYGKSFFEINREYVSNVMHLRRVRYLELDD